MGKVDLEGSLGHHLLMNILPQWFLAALKWKMQNKTG